MTSAPEAVTAPRPAGTDRRQLTYLPALDGLRAIAVVGVMLFHGGVSWARGGYLGVDVFFVLSGYLITTLLLREKLSTGHIDLVSFWARRLRRLLPALLLLLAGVAIAAPFLVAGTERASVRADGLAALFYVGNWRFILTEQSYFVGAPSPLRHLWSLSVEEQWYLLFPVVLGLVLRRARRTAYLVGALAAVAVASAVWMAHLAAGPVDPSRAYYGTDTRAHTLLVGALLALVAAQWPLHRFRRLLGALGIAGAVVILAAYVFVSEADTWMYRGGYLGLAVATAGVVAAIALPRPALGITRVLAVRPLVAIGAVSYGLYLWHWPVNVALTPERTGLDGGSVSDDVALFALRTVVAASLAVLSYRLVERPIRHGGLDGIRLRFPGVLRSRPATAISCVVLVVWLLFAATIRIPSKEAETTADGIPAEFADMKAGVPDLPDTTVVTIPAEVQRIVASAALPPVPADRPVRVMIVGDSVALTLAWGAEDGNLPGTIAVDNRAILGCGIVEGFALPGGRIDASAQKCGDWEAYWQSGAADRAPDIVLVMFGAWEVYDHKVGDDRLRSGTPELAGAIRDGLDAGIEAVLSVKPDVRFVFLGAPCMREDDPRLGGAKSERNDPERVAWVNGVFEDYADDLGPRARFVDLGDLLCPGGEFRESLGDGELRPDGKHYDRALTTPVWAWLAERVVPFARTPVAADPE
jgi:peptidoglycan/LPS O-acetylase OafA/YrhL